MSPVCCHMPWKNSCLIKWFLAYFALKWLFPCVHQFVPFQLLACFELFSHISQNSLGCRCWWLCSSISLTQYFSHWPHANAPWVVICLVRTPLWPNDFSHVLHLKRLSPDVFSYFWDFYRTCYRRQTSVLCELPCDSSIGFLPQRFCYSDDKKVVFLRNDTFVPI